MCQGESKAEQQELTEIGGDPANIEFYYHLIYFSFQEATLQFVSGCYMS
jgi:hypothetical protein